MRVDLPDELGVIAASQGGLFTRNQAIGSGVSPDEFRRAVAHGVLQRVRRGAYVVAPRWTEANGHERQILGLHALTLQLESPVVGSHETAAAVHGLELWEPQHEWLHVTRPTHSPRREAGVWHHQSTLIAEEVVCAGSLTVTGVLRTALDVARNADFEHAVVAADSALRLTGAPVKLLRDAHLRCADWPGALMAGRAVAFADARSDSVGESRLRVNLAIGGLFEPLSQVAIYDDLGFMTGVVDFLLDEKVIVEFDGRTKYGLDGLAPAAVADRLWREKQREDALRTLGYELVRVTWADLYHPERILKSVRAAQARARVSPAVRGSRALLPVRRALAS